MDFGFYRGDPLDYLPILGEWIRWADVPAGKCGGVATKWFARCFKCGPKRIDLLAGVSRLWTGL